MSLWFTFKLQFYLTLLLYLFNACSLRSSISYNFGNKIFYWKRQNLDFYCIVFMLLRAQVSSLEEAELSTFGHQCEEFFLPGTRENRTRPGRAREARSQKLPVRYRPLVVTLTANGGAPWIATTAETRVSQEKVRTDSDNKIFKKFHWYDMQHYCYRICRK